MANPLDPVIKWYRTTLHSIRVARRVLTKGITGAVTNRHVFYKQPVPDCEKWLDEAKEELERLVILALTAVFERTLRDYLVQIPRTALPPGDAHREAVCAEIVKDIEFWNISDRVVAVFPSVAANQENLNAQLKNGVRALQAPVDNLVSNGAYMVMTALAWNLKAWLALLLPEQPGCWAERHQTEKRTVLTMEFKTFVNAFVRLPCQIIRTGRKLVYRLLSWNPWQHIFFRVLEVLRC